MRAKRCLLYAYGLLLRLYPAVFRERFAPEMLQLAEAAEPAEWPLIFGDTSLAIARSWFDAAAAPSTALPAGPNAYLCLGESPVTPRRLFQGFALSIALILGLCYLSTQRFWDLPPDPPCAAISSEKALR